MAACFDEQRALLNSHQHHQSFHNNPVSSHLFRTAASLQLQNHAHIASWVRFVGERLGEYFCHPTQKYWHPEIPGFVLSDSVIKGF